MPTTPRLSAAAARFAATLAAAAGLLVGCSRPTVPTSPVVRPPGATPPAVSYALAWADEFDGPAGAPADSTKWTAEVGGQGWGNRERQYYTRGTANAALDGAGHLVITARAEPPNTTLSCWYGRCGYTSARLITKGKFATTYGRVEARLRLPRGQGIWPAFWTLGDDIDRVGWPACGEIDVMEHIGREPDRVYGTVHGPGFSGAQSIGGPRLASGAPGEGFAEAFHTYAVEWGPSEIRWLVDGQPYRTFTPANVPAGGRWAFDKPHFLLLNLAVGGNWPGDPDATTVLPQRYEADYVRVYRRVETPAASR